MKLILTGMSWVRGAASGAGAAHSVNLRQRSGCWGDQGVWGSGFSVYKLSCCQHRAVEVKPSWGMHADRACVHVQHACKLLSCPMSPVLVCCKGSESLHAA